MQQKNVNTFNTNIIIIYHAAIKKCPFKTFITINHVSCNNINKVCILLIQKYIILYHWTKMSKKMSKNFPKSCNLIATEFRTIYAAIFITT